MKGFEASIDDLGTGNIWERTSPSRNRLFRSELPVSAVFHVAVEY